MLECLLRNPASQCIPLRRRAWAFVMNYVGSPCCICPLTPSPQLHLIHIMPEDMYIVSVLLAALAHNHAHVPYLIHVYARRHRRVRAAG